jgi:hypothetical protein
MKKGNKTIIALAVVAVVVIAGVWLATRPRQPGKYDALALCLKDKGVVFYGAFWCPHCQNQKKAFGSSADLLPYVECSTADGQQQTQICKDKKITGYPTWEFKDGSRLSGEVSFGDLASKSGCPLPQ